MIAKNGQCFEETNVLQLYKTMISSVLPQNYSAESELLFSSSPPHHHGGSYQLFTDA